MSLLNRSVPDVKEKRRKWMESAHSLDMAKVVFLDESGVSINMARRYDRSIGKTRVIDYVPCNTPKKTTIVSSIRLSGK